MDGAELRDRAVVSVQRAEKLGTVEDVLVDLKQHRVSGLMLHGGLFHGGATIGWSAVHSVGHDAVMVDEAEKVFGSDGENQIRLSALRDLKVVTDQGDLTGTITGIDLDAASGEISHYVVTAPNGGLMRRAAHYTLPPEAIIAVGDDLITVDAKVIE